MVRLFFHTVFILARTLIPVAEAQEVRLAYNFNQGEEYILEIDIQGGRQVKAIYPKAVMIFILPPSAKTLAQRMGHRGRETAEAAARRLGGASSEIAAAWQYYDNMVINDDLEQAIAEVIQIIEHAPGIDY